MVANTSLIAATRDFNRACTLLLDEWQLSMDQSREYAENALLHLLSSSATNQ